MQTRKRKLEDISGDAPKGRQPLTKRRKAPLYDLIEFFQRQVLMKEQQRGFKRRKKSLDSCKFQISSNSSSFGLKIRKEHSQEMQALVIFLRFGSILSDEKKWLTSTEVFRRTGIKSSTQYQMIQRWRKRGFLIIKQKRQGRKVVLTK